MLSRISYRNQLLDAGDRAALSLVPLALYGRGVFTTLAVYQREPFLWSEHWARLVNHAGRVGLNTNELDEASVKDALRQLIEANRLESGRARITLLATTEDGVWKVGSSDEDRTDVLIITGAAHKAGDDGLALTVSPSRINTLSPLTGIKSINYLEHILAWEEARARDFDEAVVLNERGELVSTTMANLFWVKDGTIHTPALPTGALAGTTRACVMDLASELSIPLVEGIYELSDLGGADEIFLTSAGRGVTVVTTFDFHRYTVPIGSIALRLHEAFRQLTLHAE